MACPWFDPVSVLGSPRAIMPLGEAWAGLCRTPHARSATPDQSALVAWCNLGYARGKCPRFPADEGPDAVRFAVTSHRGGVVTLCCVREKGYLPFDRAALAYSIPRSRFITPHPDARVQDQARAYLESYLCRNPQAKTT